MPTTTTTVTITQAQAEQALRHLAEHDPATLHALTGGGPPAGGAAAPVDFQGLLRNLPAYIQRFQALLAALQAAGVIPAGAG